MTEFIEEILNTQNKHLTKNEFHSLIKKLYKESTLSTRDFRSKVILTVVELLNRMNIQPNIHMITKDIYSIRLYRCKK